MKKAEKGKVRKSSKEEIFAKMNASAARMLEALQGAYHAGMKEGITNDEEDQLIGLLQRAKKFRENIKNLTDPSPDTDPKPQ
jgi:hypothetical protein